jgi:hypothetical protein
MNFLTHGAHMTLYYCLLFFLFLVFEIVVFVVFLLYRFRTLSGGNSSQPSRRVLPLRSYIWVEGHLHFYSHSFVDTVNHFCFTRPSSLLEGYCRHLSCYPRRPYGAAYSGGDARCFGVMLIPRKKFKTGSWRQVGSSFEEDGRFFSSLLRVTCPCAPTIKGEC